MKHKNSLISLLISALLLVSFSSLFADVTVTYEDNEFPYNTSGNIIEVTVNSTDDIAAFDMVATVTSTVEDAFGTVTGMTLTVPNGGYDITSHVTGATDDVFRYWGFGCGVDVQLSAGVDYTFEIVVTTNCDTGLFMINDGGDWPIACGVSATSGCVLGDATYANLTVNSGTYRVFNSAPVITNCPTVGLIYNACDVITLDFDATDSDVICFDDLKWTRTVGPGQIIEATGVYTWDPPPVNGVCGMYPVTVRVTDEWGAYDECDFTITLITDAPIITDCPTDDSETFIYWGWTADGTVNAYDPDDCPVDLVYTMVFNGYNPGNFSYDSDDGDWHYITVYGDDNYLGDHSVDVSVYDGCETVTCQFVIHVAPTFEVQIEKIHAQVQGHVATVDVMLNHWTEGFGGYDLLIAYDASALSFLGATPGSILTACGFEYFTYRFAAYGNCGGPCPTGFLRVIAIADDNNGPNHPACYGEGLTGSLVELQFYVSNDRTYECMFVPVSFYWFDCGDNTFSSITGDSLFISHHVYGYDLVGELTGLPYVGGWQGLGVNCMEGDKTHPDTVVNFYNGGVDIVCADSIDRRGDLNLNGIDNEIADAVVYTNYFLFGPVAFDIAYDGQVAASDVNADGVPTSVGDLVYLIRILTGDAFPYPKLAPYSATSDVFVTNGTVTTSASDDIGALYMIFQVTDAYDVVSHTDMEVLYAERDGMLYVLIYSGLDNMSNAIPSGNNELITVTGAELVSVEASDYNGSMMNVRVEKTALPTEFSLSQNVPNPFNPSTKIGFDLPVVTDWKLDIYNVNGQLIQSYNGTNLGHVEVSWDASSVASGVYFYKLAAGTFSATKKMVLMK